MAEFTKTEKVAIARAAGEVRYALECTCGHSELQQWDDAMRFERKGRDLVYARALMVEAFADGVAKPDATAREIAGLSPGLSPGLRTAFVLGAAFDRSFVHSDRRAALKCRTDDVRAAFNAKHARWSSAVQS